MPLCMLQISSNGLISSEPEVANIDVFDPLPLGAHGLHVPLIVPLWASFRPLTVHYRVTDDPDTLCQVSEAVASRNPELSNYRPSFSVVVTMENAAIQFHDAFTVRN